MRRTAGMNELPPVRKTLSISWDRTPLGVEQPVDSLFDAGDIGCDPALEILAGDAALDRKIAEPQREHGAEGAEESRAFASDTAR